MRRYLCIESYDEALRQAKEILTRDKDKITLTTSTKTPARDLLDVLHNKPEEEPLYTLLRDEETGEAAYVYKVINNYSIYYFEPEEWESQTLPFKDVTEPEKVFLCLFNAHFIKPRKVVTPDEALTMEGAETVYSLFGSSYTEEFGAEAIEQRAGEIFRYYYDNERPEGVEPDEEDEDVYVEPVEIAPALLEDRYGVRIRKAEAYVKAFSKLVGRTLSRKEELSVVRSYEFHLRDLYLHYIVYEFLRTERYDILREDLASFKSFHLPKDWYKDFYPAQSVADVEEFVIAQYLSGEALRHFGDANLREISNKTGVPYNLLVKAYRYKYVWQI